MANYEGQRLSAGAGTGYTTVPTAAELAGCFSTPVTDPTTGLPFAGSGGCVSLIPAARFSRLAKVTIAQGFIPGANCSGCGGNPKNNYSFNSTDTLTANQQTYRIDRGSAQMGQTLWQRYLLGLQPFWSWRGIGRGQWFRNRGNQHQLGRWAHHQLRIPHRQPVHHGEMDSYLVNFGAPVPASLQTSLGFSGVFTDLTPQQRSYPYDRLWKSEWREYRRASAAQTTPTPIATTQCGSTAMLCPTSVARIPSR